ncbi:hypothetical protein MSM1_03145 [Mycobacterium sp. SM1]|uniref:hypothetical protein n=1 Tax=Mycobacterium sp. SM1 TaxID=2816243 RepID=UPI001BCE1C1D|nr:hypothetical protein [Mycobacterium sp. SM1]MBS4727397.1 hypothetical protein [Mycobacterium sp. SM1]
MIRLMTSGIILVIGGELVALLLPDRRLVLWASGAAVALVLVAVRRYLGRDREPVAQPDSDALGEALRRWVANTETLIRWSESTRANWDRHLRPMLARRFEIVTGQRRAKDPEAYQAVGRMLFGPQLWEWVNPDGVAGAGGHRPGPGRTVLQEILERLEQI